MSKNRIKFKITKNKSNDCKNNKNNDAQWQWSRTYGIFFHFQLKNLREQKSKWIISQCAKLFVTMMSIEFVRLLKKLRHFQLFSIFLSLNKTYWQIRDIHTPITIYADVFTKCLKFCVNFKIYDFNGFFGRKMWMKITWVHFTVSMIMSMTRIDMHHQNTCTNDHESTLNYYQCTYYSVHWF